MRSLERCYSVEDFRRLARRRLPNPIFNYIDGGADDEWSLENNEAAFSRVALLPRQLCDVSEIDLSARVLGAELSAPIIMAPTGMTRLFHHEKEFGVAGAAKTAGVMYGLSTMATTSLEDIASADTGRKMLQIYIHKDRGLTEDLIERARVAGYDALCLTVDTPLAGNRERDRRTGFEMPPRLTMRSLMSFAVHPVWGCNFLRDPDFRLANIARKGKDFDSGPIGIIAYVNEQFDRSLTWDDAARFIEQWGGPFAIKGLLAAEDVARAKEVGATAVFLSNHGGRQLDCTPSPFDCIMPARDLVGGEIELIVDGGVRRGTDIIKAISMGATAVSMGRPYLYALAAGGEVGVARFLDLLINELARDMALLGCRSLDELTPDRLMRV